VVVDGSTWWQVAPAPKERRYIQVAPGGATVVDTKPGVKTPATPPDSPFQPVTRQHDSDALWRQAQEADRAGNLAEAERLYAELGRVSTDETMRLLALNRAQFLRDAQRNAARTPQPRPEPVRPAPPPTPTVQPRPSPGKPALPSYPIGTAPAAGTANANNRSGPGRLERAPFQIDNRPGYVLMDSRGLPQMYVTAQDGLSLEEYVNRNVDLVGPIVYHGLLRKNYIRVTQVIPMQ
jgi:hypothetical protein